MSKRSEANTIIHINLPANYWKSKPVVYDNEIDVLRAIPPGKIAEIPIPVTVSRQTREKFQKAAQEANLSVRTKYGQGRLYVSWCTQQNELNPMKPRVMISRKAIKPRTEEETQVLGVITFGLKGSDRLWFHLLQEQLRREERMYELEDGRVQFTVYQDNELAKIFAVAYKKLSKEAQKRESNQQWSHEDEELWQNVDRIRQRLEKVSKGTLIQAVSAKLRKAANDYFRENPEKRVRHWIL